MQNPDIRFTLGLPATSIVIGAYGAPQALCEPYDDGSTVDTTVATLLGLLGGIALFLYGMTSMSDSLQNVAGDRMRSILQAVTRNPLLGVLAGAVCTAVLQSSSATTVMAIGFVGAGLMGLPQAISIILGANIGTTITAQILAFKLSDYILAFVFAGFVVMSASKNARTKEIGRAIFGFGLLFLGIDTMGSAMKPLATSPVFLGMIEQVANVPVLGVFVGTLMTLVVQSSSATIAVLQNVAAQPGADGVSSVLGLGGALPILFGDNVGTTVTALIASVALSRNAKRVAVSHCLFNISGCVLFLALLGPFTVLVQALSPTGAEIEIIARQIANAHTLFNCLMTLLWLPFIGLLAKLACLVVPDERRDDPRSPVPWGTADA